MAGQYRLAARNLALTYPKCTITQERFMVLLLDKICSTKIKWVVVARETHQDGTPHVHAAVALKNKSNYKLPTCLDIQDGEDTWHGNYKPAHDMRGWVEYICKEMQLKCWPDDFDLEDFLKNGNRKQQSRADKVALMLRDGSELTAVRNEEPGFYMMHCQKIKAMQVEWKLQQAKAALVPWTKVDTNGLSPHEQQVAEWLNKNIAEPRAFKQKQLWLWGPPNAGKTSLVSALSNSQLIYQLPYEKFWNDYSDEYDLLYCDEFKGQFPITDMNNWLQGGLALTIPTKGGQVLKKRNQATIILSNYGPYDTFAKANESVSYRALLTRLEVVGIPDGGNLFELIGRIVAAAPAQQPQQEGDEEVEGVAAGAAGADRPPPVPMEDDQFIEDLDNGIAALLRDPRWCNGCTGGCWMCLGDDQLCRSPMQSTR